MHAQDFLSVTVVSGASPKQAVQDVLRRYGVELPLDAVTQLTDSAQHGTVLLAALSQDELDQLPSLHEFEKQRTDGALSRSWTTGRVVSDFFAIMGMARTAYDPLAQRRSKTSGASAVLTVA